jgi:UDP-N-acetylglucosamine 1-carboxyvinyltransferase
MEKIVITGGKPLAGEVHVSGAKNAVLKLMAASLMTDQECIIRNVPNIKDVKTMMDILRNIGAKVELSADGVMRIQARELSWEAPDASAREMRASIQVMGPLLARLGKARLSHPGGCDLGARPVDLHLAGFRKMGAVIQEEYGHITGQSVRLRGQEIYLDYPSVGATENLMMAAVLAEGNTVVRNAAKEPEIIEVQNFLNCMGARVRGAGTDTIKVQGVRELGGADHTVIPDRIEAGTFMVAAVMTGSEIAISPVISEHLEMVRAKLREAGAEIEVAGETAWVKGNAHILPIQVRSAPHPGFPTDMQPQFLALLSMAEGVSIVTESVYTNRFRHVDELQRMGASITVDGRLAVVRGPRHLTGARVRASDLRAGAALVLAGLAADGVTEIEGVGHIDRGYENLEQKLCGLGADIHRELTVPVEALI